MSTPTTDAQPRCSFCGKPQADVRNLIAGPAVHICDECIGLCADIVAEGNLRDDPKADLLSPSDVLSRLDEDVVGHEDAKKELAIATVAHACGMRFEERRNVELPQFGILLVGPAGVGRNFLARSLARVMSVPFLAFDAMSLTNERFSLREESLPLGVKAPLTAPAAIIYIEGLDQLALGSTATDCSADLVARQSRLSEMIDGTEHRNTMNRLGSKAVGLATRGVLFIGSGEFHGLNRDMSSTESDRNLRYYGYKDSPDGSQRFQAPARITTEELAACGLRPGLAACFGTTLRLHPLSKEELLKVLLRMSEPMIEPYHAYFSERGVALEIDVGALHAIAEKAWALGLGVRGLQVVMNHILRQPLLEIPFGGGIHMCRITRETVIKSERPILS